MESSLTVAQMREADRRAIEDLGIPSVVLMNNAGKAVFDALPEGSVGIVCGKGNNGGDGFVVARYCLLDDRETHVVLLGNREEITPDSEIFLKSFENLGGNITVASNQESTKLAMAELYECDVLVDALLGTGIKGEVAGLNRAAIDAWPDKATIAVDIPSGLHGDTGEICGVCVPALKTVTFQFMKGGFDIPLAKQWCGDIIVADIGIPLVCGDDKAWNRLTTT